MVLSVLPTGQLSPGLQRQNFGDGKFLAFNIDN